MSQGLAQLRVNKNAKSPTHENKSCPLYQWGLFYFVQENNRVG